MKTKRTLISRLKQIYNSPLGVLVKLLISLLILSAFFLVIDIERLKQAIDALGFEVFGVLLFLTLLRNLSGSVRFKVLSDMKYSLKLQEIMKQYFVASFFNNFLPTALGGDGVRFLMLAKQGVPKAHAGVMIMVERFIGFYALIVIAFASCLFWATPIEVKWLVVLSAISYTVVMILVMVNDIDHGWMKRFSILLPVKSALAVYKSSKSRLFLVFFHSIAYQCISIFISYYIAVALGISISIVPFLTLVPLVWFFTMIPIGFGGVGTREISFVYLFSFIGINTEQSLLISLGTYLTLLLSGVIGAIYFASTLRGRKKALY